MKILRKYSEGGKAKEPKRSKPPKPFKPETMDDPRSRGKRGTGLKRLTDADKKRIRERAERQGEWTTKRPDRPTPPRPRPRPRPEPGPRDENKWRDWARQRNLEEKRKLDHDPQSVKKKAKGKWTTKRPDGPNTLYGGDDYDRRRIAKLKSKGKGAKRVKFPKAKHPNMMELYGKKEGAKTKTE